jgi:hypothetical protein
VFDTGADLTTQDREANRTADGDPKPVPVAAGGKSENEALASFFAGLMKRSGPSPSSPSKAS